MALVCPKADTVASSNPAKAECSRSCAIATKRPRSSANFKGVILQVLIYKVSPPAWVRSNKDGKTLNMLRQTDSSCEEQVSERMRTCTPITSKQVQSSKHTNIARKLDDITYLDQASDIRTIQQSCVISPSSSCSEMTFGLITPAQDQFITQSRYFVCAARLTASSITGENAHIEFLKTREVRCKLMANFSCAIC